MKKKSKVLLSALFITSLIGCTNQQDKLAKVDNWKKYGFEEASRGKKILDSSLITQNQYKDYMSGYDMGIKLFCSQDPYKLGMRGADYYNQCDKTHPDFENQYKLGYLEYLAYQNKLRQE